MRARSVCVCSFAALGSFFVLSDAASALQVGPVSVPVDSPPTVTVTVPPAIAVGPVVVPVGNLAPGLGATVTVSPKTGVGASVSLPSAVGPLPLLPGAPHSVQIGVSPAGAGVTLGPAAPSSSTSPSPAAPPASPATPATPSPVPGTRGSHSHSVATPFAASAQPALHAATAEGAADVPPATVGPQPGAVNASVRRAAPGGVWSLLHELASAHGLWIALLLIVAVARFAAGGLLHDAVRRRARLSST